MRRNKRDDVVVLRASKLWSKMSVRRLLGPGPWQRRARALMWYLHMTTKRDPSRWSHRGSQHQLVGETIFETLAGSWISSALCPGSFLRARTVVLRETPPKASQVSLFRNTRDRHARVRDSLRDGFSKLLDSRTSVYWEFPKIGDPNIVP